MEYRQTHLLVPHPSNWRIYGDTADNELVESIREKGIINPLLITWDNMVINGHRRLDAALRVELQQVPIIEFQSHDKLDILEALIESNRQRVKTNEQSGREAQQLLEIDQERIKQKEAERKRNNKSTPVPEQKSKPQDSYVNVGEKIGKGSQFVHQTVRVVEAIDILEERGRDLEAQQLRTTLNKSAKGAYNQAKEQGLIKIQERPRLPFGSDVRQNTRVQTYVTLKGWNELPDNERESEFLDVENTGKKFNKQEGANIEWAQWSWNPVTGCKHPCPYCYARDIANRFYPMKFEPALWPERLYAPANTRLPAEAEINIGAKNVFTCSMADLFGRWVPSEWIEAVLQSVADNPQWNFLFLTKFPIRMAEFDYPDNAWMGTSVDCQIRVKPVEKAFSKVRAKVKWLSVEPMLEPLKFTSLDMFSWVVIGGASKSSNTPVWVPPRAWVHDLETQAYDAGCMVYEKTNLQPIERLIEYPGAPAQSKRVLPEALRYLPEVES